MRQTVQLNKLSLKNDNIKILILLLLAVVFTLVNISLIFNNSVWCDEAFTLLQCKYSSEVFWENIKADAWPPFYGIAARFFARYIAGVSVPALKIFSIIPALLTMILGATVVFREFRSMFVSVVFMFLTGCMPVSIHMNLELRGYSWAMFFVTSCGLLAWKIIGTTKNKKRIAFYILYIIFALLGAYTHYYALVSIAIISLLLFIFLVKERTFNLIPCVIITLICIAAYLPWVRLLLVAAKSVAGGYWIGQKSIGEFLQLFLYPFTMEFDNLGSVIESPYCYIMALVALMLFVYLIIQLVRKSFDPAARKKAIFAVGCACTAIFTVFAGFVLSRTIVPVFIPRYLTPSLGVIWLFLALSAKLFIGNNTKLLSVFLAIIIFISSFGYTVQREAELHTGTDEAVSIIQNYMKTSPTIILSDNDYLNWTEIEYYFPESRHFYDCSNIKKITRDGRKPYLLYLSVNSFPKDEFKKLGYKIIDHGKWNFDNTYYFRLYELNKENKN